jgi:hypothetical protein
MINNILNGDVADVQVRVQYWYGTLTPSPLKNDLQGAIKKQKKTREKRKMNK